MQFKALGRHVQAEADSFGDSSLAEAVKRFAVWAGVHNDHLYEVHAKNEKGVASLSVKLVEKDAYVAPPFPSTQTPEAA